MIIYVILLYYLLYKCKYLTLYQVKDYIVWVLFCLIPVLGNVIKKYRTITIKQILKSIISFSIFPMFIISSYNMNIILELIIIPIAALCGGCIAICDYKHDNEIAKKIFNYILVFIGLMMVYYAIKGFSSNIQDVKNIEFWKSMLSEVLYIVCVTPMIVYLKWYMIYESVCIRIQIRSKLSRILIYLIIFKNCRFSRDKVICILNNISEFCGTKSLKNLDKRIKHILSKEEVV